MACAGPSPTFPVLCGHRGQRRRRGRRASREHARVVPGGRRRRAALGRGRRADDRRPACSWRATTRSSTTAGFIAELTAAETDELELMRFADLLEALPGRGRRSTSTSRRRSRTRCARAAETTAALVAELLAGRARSAGGCCVTSFDPAALLIVRERAPALPVGLLTWTRFPLRKAIPAAVHLGVDVVVAHVGSFDRRTAGVRRRRSGVAHDGRAAGGRLVPRARPRSSASSRPGVDCLIVDEVPAAVAPRRYARPVAARRTADAVVRRVEIREGAGCSLSVSRRGRSRARSWCCAATGAPELRAPLRRPPRRAEREAELELADLAAAGPGSWAVAVAPGGAPLRVPEAVALGRRAVAAGPGGLQELRLRAHGGRERSTRRGRAARAARRGRARARRARTRWRCGPAARRPVRRARARLVARRRADGAEVAAPAELRGERFSAAAASWRRSCSPRRRRRGLGPAARRAAPRQLTWTTCRASTASSCSRPGARATTESSASCSRSSRRRTSCRSARWRRPAPSPRARCPPTTSDRRVAPPARCSAAPPWRCTGSRSSFAAATLRPRGAARAAPSAASPRSACCCCTRSGSAARCARASTSPRDSPGAAASS